MANILKLKKSSVSGKIPLASDLQYGELAINYMDGRLYYKRPDDTISYFAYGGTFTYSDVAPTSPRVGDTWADSTTGSEYRYIYDGDSYQWVELGVAGGASSTSTAYTANSGTSITLSLSNGTTQIITLTANATIIMPTASAGKSFVLLLRQDATGSRTVSWNTVKWPASVAPTITSTPSKQDIYTFYSDGISWYGSTTGQNYNQ